MSHTTRITILVSVLLGVLGAFFALRTGVTGREVYAGFVTGVSSGLVLTGILLALKYAIRGSFTPWIENMLYRDAHIEGVWVGAVVTHYGIEELDEMMKRIAIRAIRSMSRNETPKPKVKPENQPVEASIVENGKERKIDAELILPETQNSGADGAIPEQRKVIRIAISPTPIKLRVDLKRVGHSLSGTITEIGGASDVHTYSLKGEFRNLILAGSYENHDTASLDRGSFSLMLVKNGKRLEGFFSVYADEEHKIRSMKCVLIKRSSRKGTFENNEE